jgi:nucleotide-binding universal stress UspA family protein
MATVAAIRPDFRFRNVLFATDFSDYSMQALPYLRGFSRQFGSKIHLWHVVTPSHLAIGAPEAAPFLQKAQETNSRKALADLLRSPELDGIDAEAVLASGTLTDEMCKAIRDRDVDLVIMGTHGRTGMRKLFLGSAVEEVCRIANRPLLTLGPDLAPGEMKFKRILFPTNLSIQSTRVLPYLLALAGPLDAIVTILYAVPLDAVAVPEARHLADEARSALEDTLKSDFRQTKHEFIVDFGEPAQTILRVAREKKADLIAMGIKNRFTPGIHLWSSVAYRVMAGARCPVLTCR